MAKASKKKGVGEKSTGDAQTQHDEQLADEPKVKCQIGPVGDKGVDILGHPCQDGTVIELPQSMIDKHRDHGVSLLDVPDDYDGEVYNVHEPYVNPDHEAA